MSCKSKPLGQNKRSAKNAVGRAGTARPVAPAEPGGGKKPPFRNPGRGKDMPAREEGRKGRRASDRPGQPSRVDHQKRQNSAERPKTEGERLHKALARAGLGSRREMEAWIADGKVEINGKMAEIGMSVFPGDRVKVGGRLVTLRFSDKPARVLLYHKPEGEIVSRRDPGGRQSVFDALPRLRGERWVAVGRLDINTSGLLLFTNSGELANRLMHPSANLLREYAARVLGELTEEAKTRLRNGVMLEDGEAAFASLEEAGGEGANRWYRVSLHEGRNREVRRLFEAVGCKVSRLIRVRYGPFLLPSRLKRGRCLELSEAEVRSLEKSLV
ncbi:MAG: pseudouridine synthase [Betaproteobacteria bacterium]|nr:pseudouridine synthase [Betaproteobacteria bacterium]